MQQKNGLAGHGGQQGKAYGAFPFVEAGRQAGQEGGSLCFGRDGRGNIYMGRV